MCVSYIPLFQEVTNDVIRMGFPSNFYSIHVNQTKTISAHFSITTFLLDVFIMFLVYELVAFIGKAIKNRKKLNR